MKGGIFLKKVIEFHNFTFFYPYSKKPALSDINISIEEGSIVGIVGPTGSGKSTLIKALNGLVPHFTGGEIKGKVIVDGLNTIEHDIPVLARRVGIVLDLSLIHI